MAMGDLARTDEYDPFAAEQFAPQPLQDWAAQAAPKDVDTLKAIGSGIGDILTLPQRAIQNSNFAVNTGVYDPAVPVEAAMTAMGGGVGGTGEKAAGKTLGAGPIIKPDPLWSPISKEKLTKPLSEMEHAYTDVRVPEKRIVDPASMVGGKLILTPWDLSAANKTVTHIDGTQLPYPVPLHGGQGFPEANRGMAAASEHAFAKPLDNLAAKHAQDGPVYIAPMTMGPQAIDASHHVADPLSQMVQMAKITKKDANAFDAVMRESVPDWVGIKDPNFQFYINNLQGGMTTKSAMAKLMAQKAWQDKGFPNVAAIRHATSEPGLIDMPANTWGMSISQYAPGQGLLNTAHPSYSKGVGGNWMGQLAQLAPYELGMPDAAKGIAEANAANMAAGKKVMIQPYFHAGKPIEGVPRVQELNQQWLDNLMEQQKKPGGFTLGSGATDEKGAAAIQGIRAYHSSPHDFDRFDLSKIGTGEGAQSYGHGLYFAENPAVSGQGGQYWSQFLQRFEGTPEAAAAQRLKEVGFDRTKAIELAQRDFENARSGSTLPYYQELKVLKGDKPVGPRTYEVNINADPAHFLDWDKPLKEQGRVAEAVKAASPDPGWLAHQFGNLSSIRYGLATDPEGVGRQAYGALSRSLGGRNISLNQGQMEASRRLSEAGIPGIKYLDEGSRGIAASKPQTQAAVTSLRDRLQSGNFDPNMMEVHKGNLARWEAELARPITSNYVIFDPAKIDILKKYGIVGAAPAGLGALAAQDHYGD